MNTAKYIPFDSVAPILLENAPAHPELPFFSGTGFFSYFPPYQDIFFITAKHCTIDNNGAEYGELKVKYHPDLPGNAAVPFQEYLLTMDSEGHEVEDLAIYVVGEVTSENKKLLMSRALRLQHQDDAAIIIDTLKRSKGHVRTVGFPSVSKEIEYENASAIVRPRGFYGTLGGASSIENRYYIDGLNWQDGELEGFSGAPVLALCPTAGGEVLRIPIGILLTGSANRVHFLSINVATNVIADYIRKKYQHIPDIAEQNTGVT